MCSTTYTQTRPIPAPRRPKTRPIPAPRPAWTLKPKTTKKKVVRKPKAGKLFKYQIKKIAKYINDEATEYFDRLCDEDYCDDGLLHCLDVDDYDYAWNVSMALDIEQYLEDALDNMNIFTIDEETTTEVLNLAQKIFYRESKKMANRTKKSRAVEEKWKQMMIETGQYDDYIESKEVDTQCVFCHFGSSR